MGNVMGLGVFSNVPVNVVCHPLCRRENPSGELSVLVTSETIKTSRHRRRFSCPRLTITFDKDYPMCNLNKVETMARLSRLVRIGCV